MKKLETEWDSYRRAVAPKGAGPVQLQEMRRAFFGGAWALYALLMNRLDPNSSVATDEDMALMELLHDEMVEFRERVLRGEA